MDLEDADVDKIRDYVGSSPDDSVLYGMAESVAYWQEIALRILRRRRADAASGEAVTNFALSGVLSVGQKSADLSALDAAIADLERQIADLTGVAGPGVQVVRTVRADRAR